ncbi:MAG: dienelactone hydrolase family protein, partial [Planctomycetota bacterium]|nr:dienelactone hydrolase family protein [Planctomycetota bacterium]
GTRSMKFAAVVWIAVLASMNVSAGEVPWLAEVTSPPADVPSPDPPLSRSPASTDLESWQDHRLQLREQWLAVLGPLPQPPESMELATISEERLEHCTRSLVRYEAEPGRFVEAYLLKPLATQEATKEAKHPAVVVFHPTTSDTIGVVAGTAGRPEQHLGLDLAKHGFVTLCPRNFLWEEKNYDDAVAAAKRRHPGSLGMATMLADGMRAVDLLAAMPDVDADRIGAIGHSLGAKEVLYLMAFDERVQVGVVSEGGIGLTFTNWDAPWYLGDVIHSKDFARDHHELLALASPRPLLILAGESGAGAADGDRTWPYVVAAQQAYRLYGEPVRLGLLNHREGHRLDGAAREKALQWIEVALMEEVRNEK